MSKVTKITDESSPGFGFFTVEGVAGYHTKEVATRVAAQMEASPTPPAAAVAAPAKEGVNCPSCGFVFSNKKLEELRDEFDEMKKEIADASIAISTLKGQLADANAENAKLKADLLAASKPAEVVAT